MTSIGSVLEKNKGGPGFDTLRLALSISILCFHSALTAYGTSREAQLWDGPAGGIARALLPVFFALSGFLVMGSALRTQSVRTFLTLRVIRIVPALATEITLSALVLGSICTTAPLETYLTNKAFLGYFGSIVGRVRTALPFMFTDNPFPSIMNTSLWTIPPELMCYVFLAMMIIAGLYASRLMMTLVCAGLIAVSLAIDLSTGSGLGATSVPVKILVLAFATGNVMYMWRDHIPYSLPLFAACLVGGILGIDHSGFVYAALPALTYCVIYAGCTRLPPIPVLSRGDYSYGIYLYAFPIQQAVTHFLPGLREWYWNIAISLPIVIVLAMGSWTFIERPALKLRKRLSVAPAGARRTADLAGAFIGLAALASYGLFLGFDSGALTTGLGGHSLWLDLLGCVLAVAGIGTMALMLMRRRHAAIEAAGPDGGVIKAVDAPA